MIKKSKQQHLENSGAKRILSLDGGGIRGILTIQMLKRVEKIVQNKSSNPDARLSDYFDLIGGTSTGAIIAAALSLGWTVDEIEVLYKELGDSIFESKWYRKGILGAKFSSKPLKEALRRELKETTLGGNELLTGLGIMTKRLDTGSPWILHNNPNGKFYRDNASIKLRNIVHASTAAPHYFKPEKVRVGDTEVGAFIDGGLSSHNNPSLQLLMLTSLKGHGFHWPLGKDNVFIVSLGTGSQELNVDVEDVMNMKAASLAVRSLGSLMNDASNLNETIMQWISHSPTARKIDMEIGDLSDDLLGDVALCTYNRYQAWFTKDWLKDYLDLDYTKDQVDSFTAMDKPENMDELIIIGKRVAERLIKAEHFPVNFDL